MSETPNEEQKLAAAHLAALLEMETSEDAILAYDMNGQVSTWSRGAERLYGHRAEDVVGRSVSRIVPPDRKGELTRVFEQVCEGVAVPAFETIRIHRDGRSMPVSVTVAPVRDDHGAVVGISAVDRDIRARIEARARLEESERRAGATFENAAVGMAHVGLDGRWLQFNERLLAIAGYSREELLQLTSMDITHPDDVDVDVELARALAAGEMPSYQLEKRFMRKNGSIVWVQLTVSMARGVDGPDYYVAVVQEIGERKRLSAALKESEARLRLAASVARIGTFEWNVRTNKSFWTPEMESLYGLEAGSYGGSYEFWAERVHPEDLPEAEASLREALVTGTMHSEWRALWPDGTVRWLEARGWVEKDPDGTPLRMIGVNLDVTDRKTIEIALRESEQRHRLALEGGELGTWIIDADRQEARWDARAREIFGLSTDSPMPLTAALAVLHPDDVAKTSEALEQALAEGGRYEIEKRVMAAEGEVRWVRTRGIVNPAKAGRGAQLVGVVHDVTAQKRAEQALEEASRRKDDYIAMLGHELRNPLAAMRSAAEVIKRQSDGIEGVARASAVLARQSAHMSKLLDGLLEVSRVTHGKVVLEKEPVRLGTILANVIEDRAPQAEAKGVELRSNLDEHASSLILEADPLRLTQVFDNIVGNAVKFTDAGGDVTLEARQDGDAAVIRVRDTGVGFSPELEASLFQVFQQGPQDLSRKSGGLGLGLVLSRNLVELHGGTILAHSEGEGTGAEVVVRLPLGAPISDSSKPDLVAALSHRENGLSVLVVEDNEDAAAMLREVLEDWGHEVAIAHCGRVGVELAVERQPDVVLCDIGLPDGMSGLDVAQRLRGSQDTQRMQLVALSGYGRPEDKMRAREAGFDAHLTKPVDLDVVFRILDEALAIKGKTAAR